MKTRKVTRRDFFKGSAAGASIIAWPPLQQSHGIVDWSAEAKTVAIPSQTDQVMDLSPARWIWYPSTRCLANTFVLFRKEFDLQELSEKAVGYISADSRYQLFVNGQRLQWGPAPCDPRFAEADPVSIGSYLVRGRNAIAIQVLYYGHGDGTWPIGKPGLICKVDLEYSNGQTQTILSDSSWRAHLTRAWRVGQYKRWYLRSLQEEFDARLYPYGWTEPQFFMNEDWLPAQELRGSANKPALCANFPDYAGDSGGDPNECELRRRTIPMLQESFVPIKGLAESFRIRWLRPPEEYFEVVTPNAFEAEPVQIAEQIQSGVWRLAPGQGPVALTFEFSEQIVGWPFFTIEASEGTIVELLVHEAHQIGGPPLLNTHFHSWTRFVCKKGINQFECFDFESLRWLQLHIRNSSGSVIISKIGARRRIYPWAQPVKVVCSDAAIQKLANASINTLYNSAQETIVDGMARERQQYSGDVGHQLHAIFLALGDHKLPGRYIRTFGQGLTRDGYFLDCWPAYDRLARLIQRQLYLTKWGPLLDHGVGFNFDCWHYYLYTGKLDPIAEAFPRLIRFFQYLQSIRNKNGLLPVDNIGIPAVWIDHQAFQQQRHKQCAFNLYTAAMLSQALAPICRAFDEKEWAETAEDFGRKILSATQDHFWSNRDGLFVVNLPWLAEEHQRRLCDRSLATSILFGQCPDNQINAAVHTLEFCPSEMGFSYPANANWRLWALAKAGRIDAVLHDFRNRWSRMASVELNNTLQENWIAAPDSGAQWSHCPVAPLFVLFMNVAGIQPIEPGFRRYVIRPQLGDLNLDLRAFASREDFIELKSTGAKGRRKITLKTLAKGNGLLLLPEQERIALPQVELQAGDPPNLSAYRLPVNTTISLNLKQV